MDIELDAAVSAFSLAMVSIYTWSLTGHFSSDKMAPAARLISAAVVATSIFFLFLTWFRGQGPLCQVVGICFESAAGGLFFWAMNASRSARLRFAFDPEHPDSIVSDGPYKHLRHPFYTSYLLFWIGWAVACWSVWAIVPVVFFVTVYVIAAKGEERKFLNSDLAADYDAYRLRTGFLIPRIASF